MKINPLIFALTLAFCQLSAASAPEEFQLGNLFEAQYGFKVSKFEEIKKVEIYNFSRNSQSISFDLDLPKDKFAEKKYLVVRFKDSQTFPRQVIEFSLGLISGLVVHELGHIAEAKRVGCDISVDILRNSWTYEEACKNDLETIAAAGLITQKFFIESLLADGNLDSPYEWGVAVFDIGNSIGYPIHDHLTGKGDLSYLEKDKKVILNVAIIGHALFRVAPKLVRSIRDR